jgi:UDP-N-acetylmuramyl tripeptide synthase
VLEVHGIAIDEALLADWSSRVERARARLGWVTESESGSGAGSDTRTRALREVVARTHSSGASLALAAPVDQLYVATEINEWALCSALFGRSPEEWSGLQDALVAEALENAAEPASLMPPVLDETAALARFERLAAQELNPRLRTLLRSARARGLQQSMDDSVLTLGAGMGHRDFDLADLPEATTVVWNAVKNIPTAIVTGSNGKTTTVRLLAACARAHGRLPAYCCTDGVFADTELIATGDYSGPAGARLVIREPRAQAAILETARGGILRRGIAVSRADVALVTNISSDHFGEYGIDDLSGLAEVKLSVAAVVAEAGLLVLNADDPVLRDQAAFLDRRFGRTAPLGWFALDADSSTLREHRARGGSTCGVHAGRLRIVHAGADHDIGSVDAMPLTVQASAPYNIANLAGAALAAVALGIPPATIAKVFARFGADPTDNMGRMMRFEVGGVQVLLDYAHNAAGLRGLLSVAEHLRGGRGRLGLVLGHAGNRRDAQIEQLARVAAEFRPAIIVIKENESHLRGRQPGEVPRLIRATLLKAGLTESTLPMCGTEAEAARCALDWARPGDVLVLPVHAAAARAAVLEMLAKR